MNSLEKIAFDDIIDSFKITHKEPFLNYLSEIWKDLSRRSDEKLQGINNLIFSKYYELPGIISDRLFAVFNVSGKASLNMNDFLKGMSTLFSDDFDQLTKFIFNFYDFNKDSFITREDVRVVLSYVPVKSRISPRLCLKYETDDFIDRVEAQDELFNLLNKTFGVKAKLSEDEFIDVIYNKCSDAFVFIIVFLLERRPFTNQTIQMYQRHSSFSYCTSLPLTPMSKVNTTSLLTKHLIVSPSTLKKLDSPTLQVKLQMKDNGNRRQSNPIKLISVLKGKSPISRNLMNNNLNDELNDFRISNEKISKEPHSRNRNQFGPEGNRLMLNRNVSTSLITKIKAECLFDDNDKEKEEEETTCLTEANDFNYEGYTYTISKSNKLKRQWLSLVSKDLYIFKDKCDPMHKSLHNLTGVYINIEPPLLFGGKKYFSFSIIYPKKAKGYYIESEKDFSNWVKNLRKASNIEPLSESYEIKEVIGKGKFGLVKLGIHKKTQRKVAIKIMNKKDMAPEDFKLAKTEIDIMKISQHPNIIKLYDVIESPEAIYIIMEHCSGGDLFAYIEKRNYKLKEKKAAEIIHKLATVIYFIHSYGIVHRDLKPENILMTDSTDSADIRLLDFGLSKIIGPKETCKEPYGTMSYVAPEVLLEKPYDQKVDLWSIGVIAYLILCGCLPFDDEHSEKEIARKTIVEPVLFHEKLWKNISPEARSFVNSLLQKNPMKRLTIKQILEHEWIKKYYTKVAEERRNTIDLTASLFKLYSTVQI